MALKMHRYFRDDDGNLVAVRAYLDKCRDGMAISPTTLSLAIK